MMPFALTLRPPAGPMVSLPLTTGSAALVCPIKMALMIRLIQCRKDFRPGGGHASFGSLASPCVELARRSKALY